MSGRTALLICCSKEEAATIRTRAKMERRILSNYVLNVVLRAAGIEEKLSSLLNRSQFLNRTPEIPVRAPGPRTTILIRCSTAEARIVRAAAKRRQIPISSWVLLCLRRSWVAKDARPAGLFPPTMAMQ
jgi:uncharacterized protein (DUF1778 family)